MPPESRYQPEQEHSIKERAHELFVGSDGPTDARATKPFSEYLRQTPAQPFSSFTKTTFWIVGIVVALLFLASIWRVTRRNLSRPRSPRPAAKAATTQDSARAVARPAWDRFDSLPQQAMPAGVVHPIANGRTPTDLVIIDRGGRIDPAMG